MADKRKKSVAIVLAGLVAMTGTNCTRKVYIPVEQAVHDTIMQTGVRIDTLMARDSVIIEARGDTVFKEIYRYRRHTKTRVDTVYKTRTDTVTRVIRLDGGAKSGNNTSRIATTIKYVTRGLLAVIAVVIIFLKFRRRLRV